MLILVLDFGGTKHTAGCLVHGEGDWRKCEQVFSPPGADARYDIRTMIRLARRLLEGEQPAAVGVSFGGPVDFEKGVVRLSHHVPGWENAPLKDWLEQEFKAPASVDNDANAAALGEYHFGAGRGCQSIFYITISTGVGGGWILNGKAWRGSEGMAGEIGHTSIDPQGPLCLCGKRGCVERLASGPYMALDARQMLEESPTSGQILYDLCGGELDRLDGKLISQAAAGGDVLAAGLIDRSAWALGVGVGNAANLVNPQRFILGGGVTKSGEGWWQRVRAAARQTALPEVHFDILPAALEDTAPLWGAAALAMDLLD
jgi:glucokinase